MSETSNSRTGILTLAKIMTAAAWADGEITDDEKLCIKDLLFQLPDAGLDAGIQLTAQEWASLDMYLESPVEEAELMQLVDTLKAVITDANDKAMVMDYLRQIVSVDGTLSPDEQQMLDSIEDELTSKKSQSGFMNSIRKLFGQSVDRRSEAVSNTATREQYFDEFINNKVYYELQQQLQKENKTLAIADEELRRIGLAGGLMARIVYVDETVTKAEEERMAQVIEEYWQVDGDTAVFIAQIALSSVDYDYDYFRMTREFYEATSREERVAFLDVLFNLAVSDGQATINEIEEIRTVSRGIHLANEEFINAKIKIPRELRAA